MQPTLEAFNLRCTDPACSFKRIGVVTPEYARTLVIQHRASYGHVVETEAVR